MYLKNVVTADEAKSKMDAITQAKPSISLTLPKRYTKGKDNSKLIELKDEYKISNKAIFKGDS